MLFSEKIICYTAKVFKATTKVESFKLKKVLWSCIVWSSTI